VTVECRAAGDVGRQGGRVVLLRGGGPEATPAATGRGQTSDVERQTLEVTEFANAHSALLEAEKGAQCCECHGSLPADVGAAFCFVLSASAPASAGETWREESGMLSPVPAIVDTPSALADPLPVGDQGPQPGDHRLPM
jgi:hypothetical protein